MTGAGRKTEPHAGNFPIPPRQGAIHAARFFRISLPLSYLYPASVPILHLPRSPPRRNHALPATMRYQRLCRCLRSYSYLRFCPCPRSCHCRPALMFHTGKSARPPLAERARTPQENIRLLTITPVSSNVSQSKPHGEPVGLRCGFWQTNMAQARRHGYIRERLIYSVWLRCFTFFETVEDGRVHRCFKKRSRLAKRNNCAFPEGSLISANEQFQRESALRPRGILCR